MLTLPLPDRPGFQVDSGHPNAGADGHNLKGSDLCAAWEEVQGLVAKGWLRRVPEEDLADTEDMVHGNGRDR